MTQLVANADAVVYTVDNPAQGQPPVPRTAHRGEEFEVSAEEAKRIQAITVVRSYPLPDGSVYKQEEPAAVPPGEQPGLSGLDAARKARADQLRRQLAALEPTAEDEPTTEATVQAEGRARRR